ncbi:S8 family serine peptidase [Pseudoduganella violaceinigra]|uniref:S8 family serine peptidase n=1 Tax=Pseudoduganella violaceinigra TaxID=246602 RepID=UPI0003FE4E72|nr:S8 family serine peptidase [Pseudoduganella violaceinigra]
MKLTKLIKLGTIACAISAIGAVASITPVAFAGSLDGASAKLPAGYAPATIMVKLRAQAGTAQQREAAENQFAVDMLKNLGVRLVRIETLPSGATHYQVYRATPGKVATAGIEANRLNYSELTAFIGALKKQSQVEYVESGGNGRLQFAPNDPAYVKYQKSNLASINAEAGWDIAREGSPVVVAVIDSGIVQHEEFGARRLPGCDMLAANCGLRGRDIAFGTANAESWHGTQVAGIIAAANNNGLGIAGISNSVNLLPVRVTDRSSRSFTVADAAKGILWAAGVPGTAGEIMGPDGKTPQPRNAFPAKVINVSLGGDSGPCSREYQNAIDKARSVGAVVVVAAGNQGEDISNWQPANCKNVVVVGGVSNNAYFWQSNFGTGVSLSAPSVGIHTTTASPESDGSGISSYYTYQLPTGAGKGGDGSTGTSFAAPHVSGALALMLSYRPTLFPANQIGDEAVKVLLQTVSPIPAGAATPKGTPCGTGSNAVCGAGVLNLGAAMKKWASLTGPSCSLSASTGVVPANGAVTWTINGTSLPAGSTAYWYGSKNGMTDVNGLYAGAVPYQTSETNAVGMEGSYVRRAEIRNPQGQAVCTTNAVTVQFQQAAPSCSLSVSTRNVALGGSYTFTVSGNNLPAGAQGYWYGSKDGTTDVVAQDAGAVPGSYSYTYQQAAWHGAYYRYMQIRSGANTVCTTNGVTVNLQ